MDLRIVFLTNTVLRQEATKEKSLYLNFTAYTALITQHVGLWAPVLALYSCLQNHPQARAAGSFTPRHLSRKSIDLVVSTDLSQSL